MSFRFKSAAAVAVGTFNIYIIQPNWLGQIGLLEREADIEMEADFSRPGFRFRAKGSQIRWSVRPDRIVLDTTDPETDCGSPLANVLEYLKWTPLGGIGTNLAFEADISEIEQLRCSLTDCAPQDGFVIGQRTAHIAMLREQQIFNLQVSTPSKIDEAKEQNLILAINVHTKIEPALTQLQANAIGQKACSNFSLHCDEAISLAERVFGIEVIK